MQSLNDCYFKYVDHLIHVKKEFKDLKSKSGIVKAKTKFAKANHADDELFK